MNLVETIRIGYYLTKQKGQSSEGSEAGDNTEHPGFFHPSFSTATVGGGFILWLVALWLQQSQESHLDPTHLERETVSSHGSFVGVRT